MAQLIRKFEYESKILQKKIEAGRYWDSMKIIAFSIDWSSITLWTEDLLQIRIKWDGKTLDFISNN